eukprot:s2092_g8.t1
MSGKSRQDQHRRDQATEREQGTSVIQMDYFFLSPEKEEEVEDESRLVSVREAPPKQHQSQGAVESIRRLPKEGQVSSELMAAMKGTPWQPRDGERHKITRELSQPIAFPAPAASGSPEREEAADREHPTLAEDGHNVDHDALVVQAAAQLEEELGEIQDAEDFPDLAGGPADVSPVPTTPAESETADPPPPRPGPSGSPPPYRGAGWSSNLQSLPDEPMSPSGLGEGGKRERTNPGPEKLMQNSPGKQGSCSI